MSNRAAFTGARLGIMGGYKHAVTWQMVDTRQVALLLLLRITVGVCCRFGIKKLKYEKRRTK